MSAQDKVAKLEDLLGRIRRNAARAPLAAVASSSAEAVLRAVPPVQPVLGPVRPSAEEDLDDLEGATIAEPAGGSPAVAASGEVELATGGEDLAEMESVADVDLLDDDIVDITDLDAEDIVELDAAANPVLGSAKTEDDLALSAEVGGAQHPAAQAAPPAPIGAGREPPDRGPRGAELVVEETTSTSELQALETDEEQVPSSSPRPKAAASMSEALSTAADELADEELDGLLKTPPPESGRQEAVPPIPRLKPPLLPSDRQIPEREPLPPPAPRVPSPRRHAAEPYPDVPALGQTFDLEVAGATSDLELDEFGPDAPTLQKSLTELSGPSPLPGSRGDRVGPPIPGAPHPRASVSETQPLETTAAQGVLKPETLERGPVAGRPGAYVHAAEAFHPSSFLELLDASLGLKP